VSDDVAGFLVRRLSCSFFGLFAPFNLDELNPAGPLPERPYTKEELLIYLEYSRRRCHTVIEGLTEESTPTLRVQAARSQRRGTAALQYAAHSTPRRATQPDSAPDNFVGSHMGRQDEGHVSSHRR
jgi:hypothetical protein